MRFKYSHLVEGNTVAQALRLAMLRLARDRAADRLPEEWKRPFYWAGFVVVGATTRLPLL
jgi:CHAT domain-containing protein